MSVRIGRLGLALAMAVLVLVPVQIGLGSSPADAAPGDPFACTTGTVFITQGPAGSPTQLYTAAADGSGGIAFVAQGSPMPMELNATAFRAADGYLYAMNATASHKTELLRIGQNGVVTNLGPVTGLTAPGTQHYNQGTFGGDTYYVHESTNSNTIFAINVVTKQATAITLSASIPNFDDFVWIDGYLWAVSSGTTMYRIDPATGVVRSWSIGSLGVPSGTYGGQWAYGNGNLGISENTSGDIFQIKITNPSATTPTFQVVATADGPSAAKNDAASCAGQDVDLAIVKNGPATYGPGGAISYTLTVTNNGPGVSSGSIVSDTLPSALQNATTTTPQCSVTGQKLNCVFGQLAVGASFAINVSATVGAGASGTIANTAEVLGNERDPNLANNTSTTQANTAPYDCASVYTIDGYSHRISSLNTSTGVLSASGLPLPGTVDANLTYDAATEDQINALALGGAGSTIYAFVRNGPNKGRVAAYNVLTNTTTTYFTPMGATDSGNVIGGAIDPTNGIYYMVSGFQSDWKIFAFNTATNTYIGQVGTIQGSAVGDNGDIAFDSLGNLYLITNVNGQGGGITVIPTASLPTTTGTGYVTTTTLAAVGTLPDPGTSGQYAAVAFDSAGALIVGVEDTFYRISPTSGAVLSGPTTNNPSGGGNFNHDMASCAYPNTIQAQKNLPSGRSKSTDQFTLTITGGGITQNNSATTAGTDTGLQDTPAETAGPLLGLDGTTYTVTESGANGANLTAYTRTWSCVDTANQSTTIASGTGSVATFTMPSGASAANVMCTFTNIPRPIPTSCDTLWYVTNTSASPVLPGTYGYVDPATGDWTQVGQLADQSSALALSRTGTTAYYAGWAESSASPNGIAYRLDLATGVSTQLNTTAHPMFQANRLAIAPDGTLWSMSTTGRLWSTTPTATTIGTPVDHGIIVAPINNPGGSGNLSGGDIAFDGVGNLWIISNDRELWVVSWDSLQAGSPQAQYVGPMGTVNFPGLAFTADGTLWGATGGSGAGVLYKVDPATGQTTSVAGSGPAFTGDLASCAAPAPDIDATKDVDPLGAVLPGATLTYTIKVTNTGPLAAPATTLTDAIPAHTAYVAGTTTLNGNPVADVNGAFPYQGGGLINSPGALAGVIAPGATATIKFKVTVDKPFPLDVADVRNQGFITCPGCDQVPTDWPQTPDPNDPTVTPVIQASLKLTKALGSARAIDTDQFTMAIRTGSATGPIVNATTNSTTSGSGGTVVTGSGTTGTYDAIPGTSYFLNEAAAGTTTLENYTKTISCTDSAGLQTGLPSNAPLGASLQITPVAGARISCIITNTAVRTDVYLHKVGLSDGGSTVSLDGSQWQLQADAAGAPGAVIANGVQPVSGQTGEFKMTGLLPGTYWLTETTAPDGYALLAQQVRFTVAPGGAVTLVGGPGGGVTLTTTSSGDPEITVRDPRALALPLAGGNGTKTFVLIGALLLTLAGLALVLGRGRSGAPRISGRRVRNRRARD
jgi:uncharacterized repeat protein (TIGR01451 family)